MRETPAADKNGRLKQLDGAFEKWKDNLSRDEQSSSKPGSIV